MAVKFNPAAALSPAIQLGGPAESDRRPPRTGGVVAQWKGEDRALPTLVQAKAGLPELPPDLAPREPDLYDRWKERWSSLNPTEKAFVANNPITAWGFRRDAQRAAREAAKRYPQHSLHNGEGDAFRHAYWNALMTKRAGAGKAKTFADAHELNGGPAWESEMDRHNNRIGRQIALAHPKASAEELAGLVSKALREGKLKFRVPM